MTSIQPAQHEYIRFQPLFQALFILSRKPTPWPEHNTVQIVRTGITTGLSQPISFESIKENIQEPWDPALDVVRTDMPTAIDFVIALERRETEAGCVDYNGTVLDNFMGDPHDGTRMFTGESLGYTSGVIRGPPKSWATDEYSAIDPPPFTESDSHLQTKKVLD